MTRKQIIITVIILALIIFWGYKVFANYQPKEQVIPQDFDTTFRNHWAKAGEFKLKEIKHTDKAMDLETQAKYEKLQAKNARIEKEKLLFWTWASLGKIQ